MEFGLSDEQKILIRSVRDFIKGWLTPLEEEVETTGRLDPEKVAERLVDLYVSFNTELKKIVAPLGRSTSLPIGMSDALGISDADAAGRLHIKYVL